MSRKFSFSNQTPDNLNISFFGNILTLSMDRGPPEEKISDNGCLCQPVPKRDHLSSRRQWESAWQRGVCTETKLQDWDLNKIVIFDFQSVSQLFSVYFGIWDLTVCHHSDLSGFFFLCNITGLFKKKNNTTPNQCFSLFRSLIIEVGADDSSSEGNCSQTGSSHQYKEQLWV